MPEKIHLDGGMMNRLSQKCCKQTQSLHSSVGYGHRQMELAQAVRELSELGLGCCISPMSGRRQTMH